MTAQIVKYSSAPSNPLFLSATAPMCNSLLWLNKFAFPTHQSTYLNSIIAYIATESDPSLEKASSVTIGPYNFTYPGIKSHLETTPLKL